MKDINIDVSVTNGMRHGIFSVDSISGSFPTQIITSANLGHLKVVGNTSIDFKTKILELYFRGDFSILEDPVRLAHEVRKLKRTMTENPEKVCLLLVSSAKTRRIDAKINHLLIKFQIAVGFKFIKVYIKHNRQSLENLKSYMTLVPEGCYLLPVLDENLKSENFKALYLHALGKVPIIGFLGRESAKNINAMQNCLFIRSRRDDRVLRLVSDITRKTPGNVPKPFLYKWLGFDAFSFTSRPTRYTIKQPLQVVRGYNYVNLSDYPNIPCEVIPGNMLIDTAEQFRAKRGETVPCSIYSIIELNRQFQVLHQTMTDVQLATILEENIKHLNSMP